MPRRSNEFRAGCYYHLYNRGVNKERIFFDNENFAFFLRQMRHYFNDAVDVVAYCLMPNHYHLLAYLHTDDLVSVMQPFVMSFAKAINKRYERVGPLFQGRFASKLIDCDDYLLHLSRYIHLNPVVTGLVGKAEEWEYSSYPEYIGLRGGTLPKPETVLALLASSSSATDNLPDLRKVYQQYVESWSSVDDQMVKHLLFD